MSSDSTNTSDQRLRFAVISDPHAISGDRNRHETYARPETAADPKRNPFSGVKALIEGASQDDDVEDIKADVVLCPGDLANRMDVGGLRYAWKEIEEIADLLGAQDVVATAGNHDVLRHEDLGNHSNEGAWIASLQALDPAFPSRNGEEADYYFQEDFALVERGDWRVVTLNSCARHGEPHEYLRGKIEDKTLKDIEARIDGNRRAVNIVLCHHHPVEWTHLAKNDTSHMDGGERLLRILEEIDPCHWILLHGHRHVPALGYAGETSSGPVRFSAGSLAVCLPEEGRTDVRNQFYLLDFDLREIDELGLVGAGRFRAWDWSFDHGMVPSDRGADIPDGGGFGFSRNAYELAAMCQECAQTLGRSVTWKELVEHDRRWLYVAPCDLKTMRAVLEDPQHFGASVEPPGGGSAIREVGFP